jgi:hypothetical protein
MEDNPTIGTYTFNCPYAITELEMKRAKSVVYDFSNFEETFNEYLSDSDIDEKVDHVEKEVEEIAIPLTRNYFNGFAKIFVSIFIFIFFGSFKLVLKTFYHLFRCVVCNPFTRCVCSIFSTIVFYLFIILFFIFSWHFFGEQFIDLIQRFVDFSSKVIENEIKNNISVAAITERGLDLTFEAFGMQGEVIHNSSRFVKSGDVVNFTYYKP